MRGMRYQPQGTVRLNVADRFVAGATVFPLAANPVSMGANPGVKTNIFGGTVARSGPKGKVFTTRAEIYDYVTLGAIPAMGVDTFTALVVVRLDDLSNNPTIFESGAGLDGSSSNSNYSFQFRVLSNGALNVVCDNIADVANTRAGVIVPNRTSVVAVSYSSSGVVRFACDGSPLGEFGGSQPFRGGYFSLLTKNGVSYTEKAGGDVGLFVYWPRLMAANDLAEITANPWRLFAAPYEDDDLAGVAADTALAGVAGAFGTASGTLSTSIRLSGSSAATATATGTLNTGIRLAGTAQAQASTAGTLSTDIRLAGAAQASAAGGGALTTSIRLAGTASAVASAMGTLAGGGAGLSGVASATSSASGTLATGIPLTGEAFAQASAIGALKTGIALSGTATAASTATGNLTATAPSVEVVDVSTISPARIVVFEGSGSRVVAFEGSGSRVVPFEGSGSRVVVFEGSGERVRIESMAVSAKVPIKVGDKWVTDRDPDEKSYYLADITQELVDRATTAVSVELVLVGVVQLAVPTIQTATKDNVQRTYAVAFLGGTDSDPPEGWKWVARVTCANGERFDKTTWFNKVDP